MTSSHREVTAYQVLLHFELQGDRFTLLSDQTAPPATRIGPLSTTTMEVWRGHERIKQCAVPPGTILLCRNLRLDYNVGDHFLLLVLKEGSAAGMYPDQQAAWEALST
jgi:hypothetical protein